MKNWDEQAEKIMIERFGKDTVIALATIEVVAITLWLTKDNMFYLFNFSYIGMSISLGIFLLIKKTNMPGELFNCLSVCICLSISD